MNADNSDMHQHHSIRLKGYDYSRGGLYFVTMCVQNHECLFGNIVEGEMILNEYGKIVEQCWLLIPEHYPLVVLHEYVIMPNHVHGIIQILPHKANVGANDANVRANDYSPLRTTNDANVGAKNFSPLQNLSSRPHGTARTIGAIVRGFKIGVTKQLGYSVWQRNYYEHIIRHEQSYQNIAHYIVNNPRNWETDKFYNDANVRAKNFSPLRSTNDASVGANDYSPLRSTNDANVGAKNFSPLRSTNDANVGAKNFSPLRTMNISTKFQLK